MSEWLRKIFGILSVLALMMTANVVPQVLCLAPDGHIALENIMSGCRGTTEAACMKRTVEPPCHGEPGHDHAPSACGATPDRCDDMLIKNMVNPSRLRNGLEFQQTQGGGRMSADMRHTLPRTQDVPAGRVQHPPPPLERKTTLLF